MCGCIKIKKKNTYINSDNIKNQTKTIKQLLEEQQKILGIIKKKYL